MVYEHPEIPGRAEDGDGCLDAREHATEEKKPKDTEEQFIYKARKKAIGPFKRQMWSIDAASRIEIGRPLEERFTFLMKQLNIGGTAPAAAKFVTAPTLPIERASNNRGRWRHHHRCRTQRPKGWLTDHVDPQGNISMWPSCIP